MLAACDTILLHLCYVYRGSLISSGGTTQQISAHREKLFKYVCVSCKYSVL